MAINNANHAPIDLPNGMEEYSTLAEKCEGLKIHLIGFIETFLWVAIILAVATALADLVIRLAPLFRKESSYTASRAPVPVDPVKFIEALKGLVDALAKAPAWLALFFAAIVLLWASRDLMPSYCSAAGNAVAERNGQAPAGSGNRSAENVQTPANGATPR
ncbi:MAG TPA: hypothetical protein VEC11_06260 [Allosphingosinicella sp.]|nr:hypothetical protein [Allosphingosinicella sp.]